MLVLSYWQSRHYARLVGAVERSGLPPSTPVYYGNYWGSGRPSEPKPSRPRPRPPMPNGRPAPIFPIGHSVFWGQRRLPRRDMRTVRKSAGSRYAGRIPPARKLLRRSPKLNHAYGLELGRRFRDRIRYKRRHGTKVTTWQLDELQSELAGGEGAARRRAFVRGVLDGLNYGRRELGDRKLPGIVFATQKALGLARHGGGSLWRSLDRASLWVVGEEYPDFVGSARGAARHESRGQRALGHAGAAGRSLARKYVAGMTPGYRPDPGLGGNVRGRSRRAVNGWRETYVRARARGRVAGFAQFGFRFQNSSQTVMRAVLRSMAKGARLSRR